MSFKKTTLGAALVAVLSSVPVYAWSDDDLQAQMNAQQASMLKIQNAFDQMQSELDAQNGRIDELKYEIAKLQKEVSDLRSGRVQPSENDDQGTVNEASGVEKGNAQPSKDGGGSAPALVTDSKGNALKAADDNAKKMYAEAYQTVVKNRLGESVPAFKKYIEKYPDNELTPNAWYWMGQVQFKQKKNEDARLSFLNAASYRNTAKRADSLYKLGLIHKQAKELDKAKRYFSLVIKDHADSASAALAQKQLDELK